MTVQRVKAVPVLIVFKDYHIAATMFCGVHSGAVDAAVVGSENRRFCRPPNVGSEMDRPPTRPVIPLARAIIGG